MEKRKVCTILALFVSAVFSLFYFALFVSLDMDNEITVVEQQSTEHSLDPLTLHWIQLGVFKESSSYQKLKERCDAQGLATVLAKYDGKTVLAAGCTGDVEEFQKNVEIVQSMDVEYILKDQFFKEEEALQLIENQAYQEVLEGYVYQSLN